jgi:hypothetical protein
MQQLVRRIRQADWGFAQSGAVVRSDIRFVVEKPVTLHRMSELAYVLNAYLTGDTGSNLIQIASIEEEESGEE